MVGPIIIFMKIGITYSFIIHDFGKMGEKKGRIK